jgi:cation:H+ antiporter
MAWLLLLAGLAVLTIGAEALVRGGAGLALRLGLTPLVIGLTVIAYGTSSPEVVVSVQAALQGNAAISIGNVIGSNICNLALILGVCALIQPLTAAVGIIRREVPIMLAVTAAAAGVLADGHLQRWEGVVLLLGLVIYTWTTVRQARREAASAAAEAFKDGIPAQPTRLPLAVLLTLGGLGLLVLGSHLFVRGAVTIAESFGLSPIVIGLTIVAVGTSLPEFATSLVAALKRQSDVAIGNIVGSNIFNILGILGLTAVLAPSDTGGLAWLDLAVVLLVTALFLPLVRSGGRISRIEGAVLLGIYVTYTGWIVVQQSS